MDETQFLELLLLRIKAVEPLIWVQTQDDDWIAESLVNELQKLKIPCEITSKPNFDKINNAAVHNVTIWMGGSQSEFDDLSISLYRHARRLQTHSSLVVLAPVTQKQPKVLSEFPILVAPLPTISARKSLISAIMGAYARDQERLEKLSFASAGLTRTQIYRVLVRTSIEASTRPNFDSWEKSIIDEKKKLLSNDLSLEVIDDPASMKDVGGMDELKIWIDQRAAVFGDEARQFGLMPPRGLLLVGIQGCGKSLIAKAIANAWNFPLLKLDMSTIFAGGMESPDAVLQRALQVADAMAPAVIWCDEIEKVFAEGSDPTTRRLLGHILNWLQERKANSFFVATANDVRQLPSELIRKGRFDELFFVDLPDMDSREQIFKIHLRKRHRDPANFDCEQLALKSETFSGAEIEQTVIAALFAAFAQKRDITQDDILDAIQDTVPLYKQREDDIKRLREWATERTRSAANNARMLSYFKKL